MLKLAVTNLFTLGTLAGALLLPDPGHAQEQAEWRWYGGNAAGQKYSALDQVTAENVHQLEIVDDVGVVKTSRYRQLS